VPNRVSNRPSRAAAKGGQRDRLIEAMTQVAARLGYSDASVARVVEQAGVSRATFYEHFADREACFLAAFEVAAERIERALPRIEAEFSPAYRSGEMLDDLLANMVRMPAATRILLVEALAGGPEVRLAHERFVQNVETTFERWLAGPGEHGYRLTITGRAVMEGIGGILLIRCFRGETAAVGELRDDLLTWLYSYAVPEDQPRLDPAQWRQLGAGLEAPPGGPAGGASPRKLPRGKSPVTPEAVAAEQRERILEAVGRLARTKGFTATTVADIVKDGGVTREAFYELFRNKEEAFLAAQTTNLERMISFVASRFFAGETWGDRVWNGLEALLGHVSRQPDVVYLDVIESYAAGSASLRRSFDNRTAYSLFFEDGYRQRPEAEQLPRLCSEAIGSAIVGLMRWHVGEGRTEQMLEMIPETAYVAMAPFIGPTAAREWVEAKAAAASA
jgi:AcrR family transcriptional regulator